MKIDGLKIASEILSEVKKNTSLLKKQGINPAFAIIIAGDDASSESYVKQKKQKAEEAGISVEIFRFDKNVKKDTIINLIKKLNKDLNYQGIIIQRPVFEQLKSAEIYYSIVPSKDVDGFLPNSPFDPPIALAVLEIMQTAFPKVSLNNKNILLIGKGETAGKPVADFLKKKNFKIQIADSSSNLGDFTKNADIIISAVGRKVLSREMLKKNAVLISVGIHKDKNNKIKGDYDEEEIKDYVRFFTPTPGGVGPVNVAFLLKNVIKAARLVNRLI